MKTRKHSLIRFIRRLFLIIFVPIVLVFIVSSIDAKTDLQMIEKMKNTIMDIRDKYGEARVPVEYIPIYMDAAEAYDIPWTLLAAHHRVETRFSKMRPLRSPVGAEGHMQFMPCTFVGWDYPGCQGLGQGDIPENEKTDPKIIQKYGGYGVDANGDGKADPYDLEDAIFSTANYISSHGAAEGQIEKAVFEYNRSEKYVEDVLFFYHKYEDARDQLEQKVVKD